MFPHQFYVWSQLYGKKWSSNEYGWREAGSAIAHAKPKEVAVEHDPWDKAKGAWKSKFCVGPYSRTASYQVSKEDLPTLFALKPKDTFKVRGVEVAHFFKWRVVFMHVSGRTFVADAYVNDDMEYSYTQNLQIEGNVVVLLNLHPELASKAERKHLVPDFYNHALKECKLPTLKKYQHLLRPGQVT